MRQSFWHVYLALDAMKPCSCPQPETLSRPFLAMLLQPLRHYY